MTSTVIIGSVFVDVKGFSFGPYAPTGTNIGTVRIVHGGVCRNVCEDFARQGEQASFVSMVDPSALGRDVCERLSALGADVGNVLATENGMGMWLAVLDDHGDLVGSISRQPDFAPMEACLREKGDGIISAADAVVLEIDTSEAIAREALRLAAKHGKPVYVIVANMGVILPHREFLRGVRGFICNEIEAGRLFGADLTEKSPEEMLDVLRIGAQQLGVHSMVITMGGDGAVYLDGDTGESGHCPAVPAEMVDSTGAGDAFFAGTVMALNRGYSLKNAVRVGARLASETIGCAESACPRVSRLFEIDETATA